MVTSRYALALQHEKGLPLNTPAGRHAHRLPDRRRATQNGRPDRGPSGNQLVLGAGDLDEAVSGLLTNGIVATDVGGTPVPSGFTRILAFRTGLSAMPTIAISGSPERIGT